MATVAKRRQIRLSRRHNGMLMTPNEFDAIVDYDERYVYELINGVLIVNPMPSHFERDPNEELGFLLRLFQEQHPGIIDKTIFE
jgi:Uma2 family endonuclease